MLAIILTLEGRRSRRTWVRRFDRRSGAAFGLGQGQVYTPCSVLWYNHSLGGRKDHLPSLRRSNLAEGNGQADR